MTFCIKLPYNGAANFKDLSFIFDLNDSFEGIF